MYLLVMTKLIYLGIDIRNVSIYLFGFYLFYFSLKGSVIRYNCFNSYYFFLIKGKLFIYPINFKGRFLIIWSTLFKMIFNDLNGIKYFFNKVLLLNGVGYKVYRYNVFSLRFDLGFSHLKFIKIPDNIFINIDSNNTKLFIYSINNILLGNFIYTILNIRKYNIYTGKGIKDINKNYIIKNVKKK